MEATIGQDSRLPEEVIIPKDSTLVRIESRYGPLGDAVRCGLSDCRTSHKKGYVVVFSRNGNATLEHGIIGHQCGAREFGETWTQAVARYDAELRTAEIRRELERLSGNADKIEPRLRALLPKLEIYSAIKSILLIDARDFMRECKNACRSRDGRLQRYGWDGKPVTYQLQGKLFFLTDSAVGKAKRLLRGIEQLRRLAEEPDTTIPKLRELLSLLGNMNFTFDEIQKNEQESKAALRPGNIAKAIRVVEPEDSRIRVEGTVLKVGSRAIDLANLQMPQRMVSWSW